MSIPFLILVPLLSHSLYIPIILDCQFKAITATDRVHASTTLHAVEVEGRGIVLQLNLTHLAGLLLQYLNHRTRITTP